MKWNALFIKIYNVSLKRLMEQFKYITLGKPC